MSAPSAPFVPTFASGANPADAHPVSTVELSVACRNLIDADVFSKSDPMVVLFTQAMGSNEWREFGRTETIDNTLNPDFVRKFIMEYYFEERQNLRFDVYDIDSQSHSLSNHDFLGRAYCSLGEVVAKTGSRFEAPLKEAKAVDHGKILIRTEEVDTCKDSVVMAFKGVKLEKSGWFGKSNPFLVFMRCNEDNRFTVCEKSEVITSSLNPTWKQREYKLQILCNGDRDRPIKVEVYDFNRNGSHNLIGEFTTDINRLEHGPGSQNVYEVVHPEKKQKKSKYKNSGTVHLTYYEYKRNYSFLEFLRGGMELNFVVAIDFTGSNGNPAVPQSLHYIHPNHPNEYKTAIHAVGNIIQDYDSDKLFPTFGFGAKLPPSGQVSHNFAVNFNPQNPDCLGIGGIMHAYESCIRSVQLYGPTNFAPIINNVASMARDSMGSPKLQYFVLLMITDGVISDMEATKWAIVNASRLPMSIIIVGVGNDEFEAMDVLDGDDVRLSSRGQVAARDIVQFVPFRDYRGKNGQALMMSQARLAKDVLAEVPDQVTGYMRSQQITPGTPPPTYTR